MKARTRTDSTAQFIIADIEFIPWPSGRKRSWRVYSWWKWDLIRWVLDRIAEPMKEDDDP